MNHLFTLFRIKVAFPSQLMMFGEQSSPPDIIKQAINEKPSKEIRKGNVWHIGNIEEVGKDGLFFALGREKKSIIDKYDSASGDFVDVEDEQAPYTYVFIDLKFQVCAISHKAKVSQNVSASAKNLANLLKETEIANANGYTFNLLEIQDTSEFLELISNAFAIKEFSISFSPPNPWDVEPDFQRPMQNLLQETGGVGGVTKINGDSLNNQILRKLTSSAAATGNKASAKIQEASDGRAVLKKLGGNPATVSTDRINTAQEKLDLMAQVRKFYLFIRNGGDQ